MRTQGLIFIALCLLHGPALAVKLVVLDVGEGQAVLLQHRQTGILLDTGHAGQSTHVLQRLHEHGVRRLKSIVLSHLHPDHASGYFRLREAFTDAEVVESGHPLAEDLTPDMSRWVMQSIRRDARHRVVRAGDVLSLGNARLHVLWPAEFTNQNLNLHSLVVMVEVGESKAMIMGDAPKEVENLLLESMRLPQRIGVLVAGHHGAADTGAAGFFRHVKPKYSVISVNADNLRGYPDKRVVMQLQRFSGQLLRTDVDGELCFRLRVDTTERIDCP